MKVHHIKKQGGASLCNAWPKTNLRFTENISYETCKNCLKVLKQEGPERDEKPRETRRLNELEQKRFLASLGF